MKCKYGCGKKAIYKDRCSKNWQSCPVNKKKNSESCKKNNYFKITGNNVKRNCQYCGHKTSSNWLKHHELHCYLNPENLRFCPVCNEIIKNKRTETCSRSCSNIRFRSRENNGNWTGKNYRIIAFDFYPHECEVCGYDEHIKVLEVHHIDFDRINNEIQNLIILCPICHTGITRKYAVLVNRKILWLN